MRWIVRRLPNLGMLRISSTEIGPLQGGAVDVFQASAYFLICARSLISVGLRQQLAEHMYHCTCAMRCCSWMSDVLRYGSRLRLYPFPPKHPFLHKHPLLR